jgi:hypothetical protein
MDHQNMVSWLQNRPLFFVASLGPPALNQNAGREYNTIVKIQSDEKNAPIFMREKPKTTGTSVLGYGASPVSGPRFDEVALSPQTNGRQYLGNTLIHGFDIGAALDFR